MRDYIKERNERLDRYVFEQVNRLLKALPETPQLTQDEFHGLQDKISRRKLKANRKNAKKSTGPRTEEGKKRSSKNAIQHGLTA